MIAIILAMLLGGAESDSVTKRTQADDISGVWQWSSGDDDEVPASLLTLAIAVEGRKLHGTYCEITNGGGHIDCAESGDNVHGRIVPGESQVSVSIMNKDDIEFSAVLELKGPTTLSMSQHILVDSEPSVRELRRIDDVPRDRGACIVTAVVDRAPFFKSPKQSEKKKTYILRGEAVLARGWSTDKNFFLATYDGRGKTRSTEWMLCKDFDACEPTEPFYRFLPEPKCMQSLDVVE